MKALLIALTLIFIAVPAFAMDVVIKQWSEFRVEIGGSVVPNQTIAERKIRNYMADRGYIVKQIIMRQEGSGVTTPWVFDFRCQSNIDDWRDLPNKEVQERLKDRPDVNDITLEEGN